jgi:hypothetical protein
MVRHSNGLGTTGDFPHTSYLVVRPLFPRAHVNKIEKSQPATETRKERSQHHSIPDDAVLNKLRAQAVDVGERPNNDFHSIRVLHSGS